MVDEHTKNSLWRVKGHKEFDGLELEHEVPLEPIGAYDCLVKIEAASINFRDLMVAKVQAVLILLKTVY